MNSEPDNPIKSYWDLTVAQRVKVAADLKVVAARAAAHAEATERIFNERPKP